MDTSVENGHLHLSWICHYRHEHHFTKMVTLQMDTVTKMDSTCPQGLFFSSSGTREGLGTKVAKS